MNLRVGMRVRDAYTDAIGTVVAVDAEAGRCTVRFKATLMTGCATWFKEVDPS